MCGSCCSFIRSSWSYFVDYYPEVPYDLSRVIFLVTGNRRLSAIARSLIDRFEIIEVDDYCAQEKLKISYSNKKKEHELKRNSVTLIDDELIKIIENYTNLECVNLIDNSFNNA